MVNFNNEQTKWYPTPLIGQARSLAISTGVFFGRVDNGGLLVIGYDYSEAIAGNN